MPWTWKHFDTRPPYYGVVEVGKDTARTKYYYASELKRSDAYNKAKWDAQDMNAAEKAKEKKDAKAN